jgi:aspartate/methionine/tyrosine aminotransferase
MGAYSDSRGSLLVRKNLARWYKQRDGFNISEDDIYLTNGAVSAYDHVISVINGPGDTALLPNPCFPFFIAFNKSYGLKNGFYSHQDKLNVIK